jgi:hypothetical protein
MQIVVQALTMGAMVINHQHASSNAVFQFLQTFSRVSSAIQDYEQLPSPSDGDGDKSSFQSSHPAVALAYYQLPRLI